MRRPGTVAHDEEGIETERSVHDNLPRSVSVTGKIEALISVSPFPSLHQVRSAAIGFP